MRKMNIIFACIFTAVVSGASLRKRSTGENPPCFVNDSGDFVTGESLASFVKKVKAHINTFVAHSKSLTQTMEREYGVQISESQKDKAKFIDLSQIDANIERPIFEYGFCYNTTSFLEKMKFHYDLLNQLANYFEHLKRTTQDTHSEERLKGIQKDIYNCMCSQKLALRSQNQDSIADVPSGDLSDDFKRRQGENLTTYVQQTLEYVSVLDSQRIASYLETIYSSFDGTSPTCDKTFAIFSAKHDWHLCIRVKH